MAASPFPPDLEEFYPEAFPDAVTPELAKSDPDAHYRNRLLQMYEALRQKTRRNPLGHDGLLAPLPMWARSYRLDAAHLAATPRLQPALVGITAYSPGKWLLEQELAARKADRTGRPTWDLNSGKDVFETAADARLAGIGLSGGGIRSATFCLGILQAYAAAGKLLDAKGNSAFDYIASVSGGGYIHQWLLSWSWNEAGGFRTVARRLVPPPAPGSAALIPEQITWLRRYSSYLTPQRGLLSADSWTMATTWLRNTTLNQVILFSFFALCIMLVRGAAWPFAHAQSDPDSSLTSGLAWTAMIALPAYLVISVAGLGFALNSIGQPLRTRGRLPVGALTQFWVVILIAIPGLLFSYLLALQPLYPNGPGWLGLPWVRWVWGGYLFLLLAAMSLCGRCFVGEVRRLRSWGGVLRTAAFLGGAAAIAAGMVSVAGWTLGPLGQEDQNRRQEHPVRVTQADVGTSSLSPVSAGDLAAVREEMPISEQTITRSCTSTVKPAPTLATEQCTTTVTQVPEMVTPRATPPFTVRKCLTGLPSEVNRSIPPRVLCLAENWADGLNGHLLRSSWLARSALSKGSPVDTVTPACLLAVLGPSLFFFYQFLAFRLQVGLLGRHLEESRREWLARFGAWSAIASLTWVLLGSVVLFAPFLMDAFLSASPSKKLLSWLGVVAVHGLTLFAGSSSKTDGKPNPNAWFGYSALDLVGMVGAPICIVLLLMITASLVSNFMNQSFPTSLLAFAVIATVFAVFGWRVNVNKFSLAPFYRNRLARCYLGGNNPMRNPDPFTGFDEHEQAQQNSQMALSLLLPERFGGVPSSKETRVYNGPFPIFCSTVTLTFGGDLAWQERKGTSFTFTPLFSGYHVGWTANTTNSEEEGAKGRFAWARRQIRAVGTWLHPPTTFNGFVPTKDFATTKGGIDLPTVAAISGAALSPNQGVNSQPALAFLMTLFNVRLGWWITNPRKPLLWRATRERPGWFQAKEGSGSPVFGPRYLLSELFGLSDDTTNYVNLCDGGNFDNMGLYELVRRRCSRIVICDGEMDVKTTFEGIGLTIAKCRLDFGVEIELNLKPLEPDPVTKLSKAHFVVGHVHYPAPPGGDPCDPRYTGEILYMKTTLTGNEPADIVHYKRDHPDFPQQSTLNQWFTETQFESYRKLGELVGSEAAPFFRGV